MGKNLEKLGDYENTKDQTVQTTAKSDISDITVNVTVYTMLNWYNTFKINSI